MSASCFIYLVWNLDSDLLLFIFASVGTTQFRYLLRLVKTSKLTVLDTVGDICVGPCPNTVPFSSTLIVMDPFLVWSTLFKFEKQHLWAWVLWPRFARSYRNGQSWRDKLGWNRRTWLSSAETTNPTPPFAWTTKRQHFQVGSLSILTIPTSLGLIPLSIAFYNFVTHCEITFLKQQYQSIEKRRNKAKIKN